MLRFFRFFFSINENTLSQLLLLEKDHLYLFVNQLNLFRERIFSFFPPPPPFFYFLNSSVFHYVDFSRGKDVSRGNRFLFVGREEVGRKEVYAKGPRAKGLGSRIIS